MDTIQKELLEAVSGLHEIPVGAYNIRTNGKTEARNSTEHIEIIPREAIQPFMLCSLLFYLKSD